MPSASRVPTNSAQLPAHARSAGIGRVSTPCAARNSSASAESLSARRPVSTTLKRCDAKTRANAAPMPADAPGISAVRLDPSPDSFVISFILSIEIFGANIVDQPPRARLQASPIGHFEIQHRESCGGKFLREFLQTSAFRRTFRLQCQGYRQLLQARIVSNDHKRRCTAGHGADLGQELRPFRKVEGTVIADLRLPR